jgi:hypothetical protein
MATTAYARACGRLGVSSGAAGDDAHPDPVVVVTAPTVMPRQLAAGYTRAFVKVQDGCQHRRSFASCHWRGGRVAAARSRLWSNRSACWRRAGAARPRWTPENRPVVDRSKPASGVSAPSTRVLPHRSLGAQERRGPRHGGEAGQRRVEVGGRAEHARAGGCPGMGRPEIVDPGGAGALAARGRPAHASLRSP